MNKTSKSVDNQFQSYIESEMIFTSRIMCILASILYSAFILADIYSVTAPLSEILFARLGAIFIFMTAFIVSFHKSFTKYYEPIIFLVYLSSAAGIEVIIYLSLPEDIAAKVYFAGLLLVIMMAFTWSFFRINTSILAVSLIIVSYISIGVEKDLIMAELLVNVSLLLSAGIMGFVAQIIRNKYLRENFILTQSLEKAYEDMEDEAKRNAHLANHDSLTGLPNRRFLVQLLEKALMTAREQDKVLTIIFLDLNGFKQVNDTHGHDLGDEVLKVVAQRLADIIPVESYLSRLGGDEYVVGLILEKNEVESIDSLSTKISDGIGLPMIMQGEKINIGTSFGAASYPNDGDTITELMKCADYKMYQNKKLKKETESRKTG